MFLFNERFFINYSQLVPVYDTKLAGEKRTSKQYAELIDKSLNQS